jgi:hypothetical protein
MPIGWPNACARGRKTGRAWRASLRRASMPTRASSILRDLVEAVGNRTQAPRSSGPTLQGRGASSFPQTSRSLRFRESTRTTSRSSTSSPLWLASCHPRSATRCRICCGPTPPLPSIAGSASGRGTAPSGAKRTGLCAPPANHWTRRTGLPQECRTNYSAQRPGWRRTPGATSSSAARSMQPARSNRVARTRHPTCGGRTIGAWIVVTEVDGFSTYVGCDRVALRDLLDSPDVEAIEVTLDTHMDPEENRPWWG